MGVVTTSRVERIGLISLGWRRILSRCAGCKCKAKNEERLGFCCCLVRSFLSFFERKEEVLDVKEDASGDSCQPVTALWDHPGLQTWFKPNWRPSRQSFSIASRNVSHRSSIVAAPGHRTRSSSLDVHSTCHGRSGSLPQAGPRAFSNKDGPNNAKASFESFDRASSWPSCHRFPSPPFFPRDRPKPTTSPANNLCTTANPPPPRKPHSHFAPRFSRPLSIFGSIRTTARTHPIGSLF